MGKGKTPRGKKDNTEQHVQLLIYQIYPFLLAKSREKKTLSSMSLNCFVFFMENKTEVIHLKS